MANSSQQVSNKKLIIRLLKANYQKHAKLYIKAIISMVIVGMMTGATALMMKHIIDGLTNFKSVYQIFLIAIGVFIIFLIKGLGVYFQTIYLNRAGNSLVAEQQKKIYNRLIEQGVSFFHNNAAADLLVRVTNSAQAARQITDTLVSTYIRDLISLISLVGVMIWTNYWLALIALIIGPGLYLTMRSVTNKIRALMEKEVLSLGKIMEVMQETSLGIRVIKAFALEEYMAARMNKAIDDVKNRANAITKLRAATSPASEMLAGLSISIVLAITGVAIANETATPGDLMAFVTAILLAYEPAKRLTNSQIAIAGSMVGLRMMFEILDHPVTLKEDKNAIPLPKGEGKIDFQNVSFAYENDNYVLKNINCSFPPKKTTAIIGPSGSGKSSLINLLMRLYDPQEGQVLINGQNIKNVTFDSLRERISYVGQDIFLFQGSIHSNIALSKKEATKEEVIEAAIAANAHQFIMDLPNGYDTILQDNATNLSGGQKQRIAIARAILRNSEILILDEATSALDSQTEAGIREALEKLSKDRTTVMIAHRFSAIARAHHIIVLDKGTLCEQGTKKELLAKNGLYKKLHDLQFGNPDEDINITTLDTTKKEEG